MLPPEIAQKEPSNTSATKQDVFFPFSPPKSYNNNDTKAASDSSGKNEKAGEEGNSNPATGELTPEEEKMVKELKSRDQAVRAHENAHKAAGGGLVRGTTSFSYTTGPDGKKYATGGEVKIDISEVPEDPRATIRKMQQVRRAALAPADPSAQDRAVAAKASSIQAKATVEMQKEQMEEMQKKYKEMSYTFSEEAEIISGSDESAIASEKIASLRRKIERFKKADNTGEPRILNLSA